MATPTLYYACTKAYTRRHYSPHAGTFSNKIGYLFYSSEGIEGLSTNNLALLSECTTRTHPTVNPLPPTHSSIPHIHSQPHPIINRPPRTFHPPTHSQPHPIINPLPPTFHPPTHSQPHPIINPLPPTFHPPTHSQPHPIINPLPPTFHPPTHSQPHPIINPPPPTFHPPTHSQPHPIINPLPPTFHPPTHSHRDVMAPAGTDLAPNEAPCGTRQLAATVMALSLTRK
ncbi:hypothetical protein Pcinc_008213 [Petrolisthes cinctipes]|uniref:Uncharacterized protein n=1 Tax=Petrolisthes cinctipes TaxID=88211 RepID=A0AAE1G7Q9_PETCI|nr:hypothetical protein Pcinc_008213 [Petrolisthes cinctipes]